MLDPYHVQPPDSLAAVTVPFAGWERFSFWYDSFDQLSRWIAAERDTARLHQHRAALLDQVGLADVAAFDRR